MNNRHQAETVVAEIDLERCPKGPVLQPLAWDEEIAGRHFPGWESPLAPRGTFNLRSSLTVVEDSGRRVLEVEPNTRERALVAGSAGWRDCRITMEVKPIEATARPHEDNNRCAEALTGIVFRVQTSRRYYHFGIEGRRRAVLYRRDDDEWHVLAEAPVTLPDGFVNLEVALDGDGIRCACPELGVDFLCTDTMFAAGKAGMRAIGQCHIASLRVTMDAPAQRELVRRRRLRSKAQSALGRRVPSPVLVRTFDLAELGGTPLFADFARPDVHDMLVVGKCTRALTADGRLLWEFPEPMEGVVFSAAHTEHGRLIYGFVGQRKVHTREGVIGQHDVSIVSDELCVIAGADGRLLARCKVPDLEPSVSKTALTLTSCNLTGGDAPTDIVLREWRLDMGNAGVCLWAFSGALDLLWSARVEPPYGHTNAVQTHDVNGDGRDEVLAGGTLFSHDGRVLWVHDLAPEMAGIHGAHHYDSVAVGNFSEDPGLDPVAFLLGGSAGVYVVDARTGRTRMVHHVGHAQGHSLGRVRDDMPGTQVLVACRWGNMGIQTLLSGRGDRLWSIQPDYLGQGSRPVWWGNCRRQLIWVTTSDEGQGLYDGYGRRVKDLPEILEVRRGRQAREVISSVARIGDRAQDLLCVAVGGKLYAFGPSGRGR